MKQGLSLQDLVRTVQNEANSKTDLLVPTVALSTFTGDDGTTRLYTGDGNAYPLRNHAHRQIGSHLNVPAQYYDRIREQHPELYDHTTQTLFQATPDDERRLIRLLGGECRAFLSNRYRRLDNLDLLDALIPVLHDLNADYAINVVSCNVSETKLYIKLASDRLTTEIQKGDVVQVGLVISNSEIGDGSVRVEPFSLRLICTNGMTHSDLGLKRYHVGRASEADANFNLLSDEALEADDRAFWLKFRDTVRGSLSRDVLDTIANQMREALGLPILAAPKKAVEVLGQKKGLSETERETILENFIQASDRSLYSLANAVTFAANTSETYDRASELERLGGSLLSLDATGVKSLLTK